jgi:hypothetical protein
MWSRVVSRTRFTSPLCAESGGLVNAALPLPGGAEAGYRCSKVLERVVEVAVRSPVRRASYAGFFRLHIDLRRVATSLCSV